jgi:hypothetical protein
VSNDEVAAYGLNGRNFSQLITMAPGVSNQTGQDEAKVGVAGSAKFSVNGGRVEYNTFEVDGSDVLNTSINSSRGQGEPLVVYPSIDAIQDMKILTADYSALNGKSASGSIIVSTKSGTDKFHGSAYGFVRHEMFRERLTTAHRFTGGSMWAARSVARSTFRITTTRTRRGPFSSFQKRFGASGPLSITTRPCRQMPSGPEISPLYARN